MTNVNPPQADKVQSNPNVCQRNSSLKPYRRRGLQNLDFDRQFWHLSFGLDLKNCTLARTLSQSSANWADLNNKLNTLLCEPEYAEIVLLCQGQSPQKGLYGEKGLWFNTNVADRLLHRVARISAFRGSNDHSCL
jgi:hypothetical protein